MTCGGNSAHDCATAPNLQGLRILLEQAFEMASTTPQAFRIEIPIAKTDPLHWLQAQTNGSKIYWSDREGRFEMAGLGQADCVEEIGKVEYSHLFARLVGGLSCAHPGLRYYGGIQFAESGTLDTRWKKFGAYRFVVPRFELLNRNGLSYFVCNAFHRGVANDRQEFDAILSDLAALTFSCGHPPEERPRIVSRQDQPDGSNWRSLVSKALDCFEQHQLEKVVLARETRLECSKPINPWSLITRLQHVGNGVYHFCFQPEPGVAFVGASPERLYKRVSGYLQSEAIAGTRPRGRSDTSDAALGEDLLHNEKELREHRFVRDNIRQAFESLCREVRDHGNLSLVRLRECQHLACSFEGILTNGHSDVDIMSALHPTPAVGGFPTQEAVAWIRANEPFERGWYAGPVGWIGYDSSEFAVAIRSALIDGTALSVYTGAGVVPGSDPAHEWQEIEDKIGTFLHVLADAND